MKGSTDLSVEDISAEFVHGDRVKLEINPVAV